MINQILILKHSLSQWKMLNFNKEFNQGKRLSMFIILPSQIDGLPTLESNLPENFFELIHNVSYEVQHNLYVEIPKFKIKNKVDMKKILIKMGISDAFDGNADLSGISTEKNLFISKVFQKAFINVNEKGCEAAAATGI